MDLTEAIIAILIVALAFAVNERYLHAF